jgi:hypothetical protein
MFATITKTQGMGDFFVRQTDHLRMTSIDPIMDPEVIAERLRSVELSELTQAERRVVELFLREYEAYLSDEIQDDSCLDARQAVLAVDRADRHRSSSATTALCRRCCSQAIK